jgi:capsular exopolysaccharide synthesis family protein
MTAARRIPAASPPPPAVSLADRQVRAERDRRLSATLLKLGRLNEEAVARIAEMQRATNAPFAKAASKLGLITKEDVATALAAQNGFLRESEGEGRLPADLSIVRRPRSKEAEQFRALRTRLITGTQAEKLNLFAIAANESSVEADHVALNMAASFAQIGRRALIVDADLRGSRLSARFGVDKGPGLKETLVGATDIRSAVRPTIIANLSVLTAGGGAIEGGELLSSETLKLTFDYLRCAYDLVVVMTTPFGEVADAQFAWAAAGEVFVVARRHKDRLADLAALDAALRQVDAAVIGAALAG